MKRTSIRLGLFLMLVLVCAPLWAAESQEDLAKASQNPVADMVSIPVQSNFNFDYGQDRDKSQIVTNVQPVIPLSHEQGMEPHHPYHNPDNLHGIPCISDRTRQCAVHRFFLPRKAEQVYLGLWPSFSIPYTYRHLSWKRQMECRTLCSWPVS